MKLESKPIEPVTNETIKPEKQQQAQQYEPLQGRRVMDMGIELLRKRKHDEVWKQFCGFIDLSMDEVMNIQRTMLMKQVEHLKNCKIGKLIMRGASPTTVEEFREQVPLTSYQDYAPYLLKRVEEVLPAKPLFWGHTSGRSGEYDFKWAPITSEMWDEIEKLTFAAFCFSSCNKRGDVKLRLHDKLLYGAAPVPYITGLLARYAFSRIFDYLPPLDEAESLSFQERGKRGITMALNEGLDYYCALPSVIVAVGERMGQGGGSKNFKALMRQPKLMARILKGVIKSKMAHRPLLPKDVWSPKGIISAGSDGSVYKDKIEKMWGRRPLDFFACTEGLVISLQTWDYEGLTFYPYMNFFEFIPEEECLRARVDPTFKPRTLLLDEVKAGQNYQLVMTNILGGPFVRYKVGDMIRITALRNDKLNIDIPQMVYHARIDDMIDIAGFTRLTESVIWKALESSGIAYEDWTARKELKDKPILRLYLEPKDGNNLTPAEITDRIHKELVALDKPYSELESYIGLKPLEVSLVPKGAFSRYMMKQLEARVELGRLKVSHLNPSDEVVQFLLNGKSEDTVGPIMPASHK